MKKAIPLMLLLLVSLACQAFPVTRLPLRNVPTPEAVVLSEAPSAPATLTVFPSATIPVVVPTITETPAEVSTQIPEGALAREHIVALSQGIGARVAGTIQEKDARIYITLAFEKMGYQPVVQEFSTTFENEDGEMVTIKSANVIAVKQGESTQEIIVGGHYDSTADAGSGADDNASAIGVLLEVAEHLREAKTPFTIRFIAFGSEEIDLNGAYAYAGQMSRAAIDNTLAMINLDSLAAGDNTYLYSDEGKKARLRDWALDWAGRNGFNLQTMKNVDLTDEDGYGISDYFPFRRIGIPYAYFEATNWNLGDQDGYTQVETQYGENGEIWHTQYDQLAYLDKTFPGRVDENMQLFVSVLQAILTEYSQ
jgi:hypothetical protein